MVSDPIAHMDYLTENHAVEIRRALGWPDEGIQLYAAERSATPRRWELWQGNRVHVLATQADTSRRILDGLVEKGGAL